MDENQNSKSFKLKVKSKAHKVMISKNVHPKRSAIFAPLKALGLTASDVPVIVRETSQKDDYIIISAVGQYFIVYRMSDLAVLSTSDMLSESIGSMAAFGRTVLYCGCDGHIFAFKRLKHVFRRYAFCGCSGWRNLIALESKKYLCAVATNVNKLVLFNTLSSEVYRSVVLPADECRITAVLQPQEFKHKLLIAGANGSIHIYNYNTDTFLYSFSLDTSITYLTDTPQKDVVAFGCMDGSVLLHNVRADLTVMNIQQDMGPVSAVTFRTDSTSQVVAVIGTVDGHIALFDITAGRAYGQSRHCHSARISTLLSVGSELVSSGADNALKVWTFDRPDGSPLLHRSRFGHWQPPHSIEFWPSGRFATKIVSGGEDGNMHVFSTIEPKHNFSMGRAYRKGYGKRDDRETREKHLMPPPVDMTCCALRDGYWDSIAVCHSGCRQVTTWSFNKQTRGRHFLDWSTFISNEYTFSAVSACRCAISPCGNYVVIGYSSGHVVKFNIQSGIERGNFRATETDSRAHESTITGLQFGLSNTLCVIVTAGGDIIRMWNFVNSSLLQETPLRSSVNRLRVHPDGTMVAALTADGRMTLLELHGLTVFRRISMGIALSDVAFFHRDGLAAVADGSLIRTVDYINGHIVDCFKTRRPVTALQLSPDDAILATSHRDDLGIYLWSRLAVSVDGLTALSLEDIPTSALDVPVVDVEKVDEDIVLPDEENDVDVSEGLKNVCMGSLTMAPVSCSYLATVMQIERVLVRRQKEAKGMTATETFFLPHIVETARGLAWKDTDDEIHCQQKKRHAAENEELQTDMVPVERLPAILMAVGNDDDRCDFAIGLFVGLTEATIDYELRMLDPDLHPDGFEPLLGLLKVLRNQLVRRRCVDLCGVLLWTVLKHNGDFWNTSTENTDMLANDDEVPVTNNLEECLALLTDTKNAFRAVVDITDQFRQISSLVDFVSNGII